MKTALITGITGQDGAYMARLLLQKGYRVYGTYRRSSSTDFWRLRYLGMFGHEHLHLINHDITDSGGAFRLMERCEPDEVYNLGAQTFVGSSFDQPTQTSLITGLGVLNMLEAIRTVNPRIRFYQASSAEMFGKVQTVPQTEATPLYPRSPYGVAKVFAHWMTINFRESYDMFAGIGILFNHESPLRGEEFVTRKITAAAAAIKLGSSEKLALGNLDARRDWGFAGDFVEGIWAILQADKPDTFVLATNTSSTVRAFADTAFEAVGLPLEWRGEGAAERGHCAATGRELVHVDPAFQRPAEVDYLLGDPGKAERVLGWRPKTSVKELCAIMVQADLKRERQRRDSLAASFATMPQRADMDLPDAALIGRTFDPATIAAAARPAA
ncbi:GDP-mannose 4,6-dehydratase [uncultured Sphingomonas sp.]|uniref:GDP-mannose 4,6-dehydratase n=1 Tax=uncultured Sphingomonas sp. TaxID=158754 RepID=UPI0026003A2E|nr:GDP-mannose 4,6-dehydratase [uncultured Sphingomonas sp.]